MGTGVRQAGQKVVSGRKKIVSFDKEIARRPLSPADMVRRTAYAALLGYTFASAVPRMANNELNALHPRPPAGVRVVRTGDYPAGKTFFAPTDAVNPLSERFTAISDAQGKVNTEFERLARVYRSRSVGKPFTGILRTVNDSHWYHAIALAESGYRPWRVNLGISGRSGKRVLVPNTIASGLGQITSPALKQCIADGILPPETKLSELRTLLPPDALEQERALLKRQYGVDPSPVIDFYRREMEEFARSKGVSVHEFTPENRRAWAVLAQENERRLLRNARALAHTNFYNARGLLSRLHERGRLNGFDAQALGHGLANSYKNGARLQARRMLAGKKSGDDKRYAGIRFYSRKVVEKQMAYEAYPESAWKMPWWGTGAALIFPWLSALPEAVKRVRKRSLMRRNHRSRRK